MKIECPWKNCSGVIDLSKEFRDWPKKGRTSWLIHTLMCPKCGNVAGHMELSASCWVSFKNDKDKKGRNQILDTKTKKPIYPGKDINRYLKEWARNEMC